MKVSDWMRSPAPTATLDTSVGELARSMTQTGAPHVVMVDDTGMVIGLVTARDLVAKHATLHFPTYFSLLGYTLPIDSRRDEREIERALATTARQLMTPNPPTIGSDADVDEAASLMMDRDVSALPVTDDNHVVGIISDTDIVRLLVVEESD